MILGVAELAVQHQQAAITIFATAERMYPQNPEIGRISSSLYNAGRSAAALPHLRELAISLTEDLQ
jgi:hypothetical protein